MYAKVENGQVIQVGKCPQNTERVSNFILLDDEDKKLHGWFKVIEQEVSLQPWQSVVNSTYEYNGQEVYETKVISSVSLDDWKVNVYSRIAEDTKNYVMSITPEYKQLSALAGNYPLEECDKIKAFAKKHVDEARALKVLIFGATTYEEVVYKNVKFDFDTLEPVVEPSIERINMMRE